MKKRQIKIKDNTGLIELLGAQNQFVACGTHTSGVRYQWKDGLPDQIPTLSQEVVNSVWTTLTKTYATSESAKANQTALEPARTQTNQETLTEISDSEWQDLLNALRFLKDHVNDNQTWSEIGYALLSLEGSRPARQLWIDFSKKAQGYEEGAPEAWWGSHRTQKTRTDYRHIFNMARQRGLPRVADPGLFPPVIRDDTADGGDGAPEVDVPPSPPPDRPVIQLSDTRLPEIVHQIEDILVPHVFVQGTHLVRETEAHKDALIHRSTDAVMLIQVTTEWLMVRMGELAQWRKWIKADGGSWVNTKPSVEHIGLLFNQGGWTQLRPLDAISRSPFVRPDGSICDQPGYDNRARVLYVPNTSFPPVPTDPSQDTAREALGRIRGVFDQFPYKESASESAFLSHVLSEAARVAIDRCPMFFYDAPSAGTGKGLLQEMAARIVHGSDPALRPWVGDHDEIRKALYAAVLAGDRSLWFDNLPDGHKTRSPELCAFITSSTWTDRKLGESTSVGVPNKMVVCASGNNITPTGDLARRSLVIRMDANTERMKERTFRIPLLREYVMAHRAELLVDALTIIRAYDQVTMVDPDITKGMPVPLPSFERWSHFCRNPLIWLGLADPVITQNETDDETTSVGSIYEALSAQFGDREFTALDVAHLVNGITDSSGELANQMMQNGCKEPNNPTKIGYWMRGYRDRISNGLKLTHAGMTKVGVKWKFVKVQESLT
jgi:hypothetical protein